MIGRAMNGGSVKNTVFVFAMTAGYNAGAIACWTPSAVSVDNVFVSASINSPNGGALFGRSTSCGAIKNTVIHVNCTGGWNNGAISGWKVSASVTENVYVIFEGSIEKIYGNSTEAEEGVTTMKKEEVASNAFTGLDAKYWNVAEGEMPVFNSMADIV